MLQAKADFYQGCNYCLCPLQFVYLSDKKIYFPLATLTLMLIFDWQGLFRNYGNVFLSILWPHLEQLASDPHESSQRCVCEITAGLIRGSKHWSFSKVPHKHNSNCPPLKENVKISKNFHQSVCVRWTGYGSFSAL